MNDWKNAGVVTFSGSGDTKKYSGADYNTLSLGRLWTMQPGVADKMQAAAMIPSTYVAWDARTHEVQRERGQFVALTLDVDSGNLAADVVVCALREFAGDAALLVYSSSSATAENRKWRGVIPLAGAVGFADWELLQHAMYSHFQGVTGVRPDYALARAGQPVYLPNVPKERRGNDGEPLFFERVAQDGAGLDAQCKTVQNAVSGVLAERARIAVEQEKAKERARSLVAQRTAQYGAGDKTLDLVARFNQSASVADLLAANGYTQRGNSADWRSPYQSSGTYATRDYGGFWISLSESDARAGLGRQTAGSASMCFGDAFDLFCHFDHGNDFKAAIKALAAEERGERRSDYARFESSSALDDFAEFIQSSPEPEPVATKVVATGTDTATLSAAMERISAASLEDMVDSIPAYIEGLHGIDDVGLSALASHYKACMKSNHGVTLSIKDARTKIKNKALESQKKAVATKEREDYQKASCSSELLRDWVYVEESEKFANLRDGRLLSSKSFDMIYAKDVHTPPEGEKPQAAHKFFALQEGRTVYAQMYVPQLWRDGAGGQFFEHELRYYLNSYHGHTVPPTEDGWQQRDTWKRVKSHIERMMENEAEAKLLIQWMAHNVQYPGLKILWAPVILGPQGVGKSTIGTIMGKAMGQSNTKLINMSEVYSSFSGWAQGACVAFIEEIRIVGHSRYDVMNKLKEYITNDRITVVFKGRDGLNVLNTQNYCCFTNFEDAMVLDEEDRRYGVFATAQKTRAEADEEFGHAYFLELHDIINAHPGDIRAWLLGVDLEGFSRTSAPPMTRAKMDMISQTRGDDAENLEMVLQTGGMGLSNDVVSTSHVNTALRLAGFPAMSARRLGKALKDLGFVPYSKTVKFDGGVRRFAVRGSWIDKVIGKPDEHGPMIANWLKTEVTPKAADDFS